MANQRTIGNAGVLAGSRTTDHLIKSPLPPCNISDLVLKSMHTNAYEALECIRNAYKVHLYYSLQFNGNFSSERVELGFPNDTNIIASENTAHYLLSSSNDFLYNSGG